INGEIQYQHVLQFLDPIPPNPQYVVSLDLSGSANFTYLCTVCTPQSDDELVGAISVETHDKVYVPETGNYNLVRSYEILGRNDGMVLKCSFHVTSEGIGLNTMWLELSDGNQSQNELNKTVG